MHKCTDQEFGEDLLSNQCVHAFRETKEELGWYYCFVLLMMRWLRFVICRMSFEGWQCWQIHGHECLVQLCVGVVLGKQCLVVEC